MEVENIKESIWNALYDYWWLKLLPCDHCYGLHDYTYSVKFAKIF